MIAFRSFRCCWEITFLLFLLANCTPMHDSGCCYSVLLKNNHSCVEGRSNTPWRSCLLRGISYMAVTRFFFTLPPLWLSSVWMLLPLLFSLLVFFLSLTIKIEVQKHACFPFFVETSLWCFLESGSFSENIFWKRFAKFIKFSGNWNRKWKMLPNNMCLVHIYYKQMTCLSRDTM